MPTLAIAVKAAHYAMKYYCSGVGLRKMQMIAREELACISAIDLIRLIDKIKFSMIPPHSILAFTTHDPLKSPDVLLPLRLVQTRSLMYEAAVVLGVVLDCARPIEISVENSADSVTSVCRPLTRATAVTFRLVRGWYATLVERSLAINDSLKPYRLASLHVLRPFGLVGRRNIHVDTMKVRPLVLEQWVAAVLQRDDPHTRYK